MIAYQFQVKVLRCDNGPYQETRYFTLYESDGISSLDEAIDFMTAKIQKEPNTLSFKFNDIISVL